MLHIILAILKVIGILLLIIVTLILLIGLSLCFMPFHYRLYFRYGQTWHGRANLRFLGPILMLRVVYDGDIQMKFRICGIPFGGRGKSGKHARRGRGKPSSKKPAGSGGKKPEAAQASMGAENKDGEKINHARIEKKRYGAEYVKSVEELEDVGVEAKPNEDSKGFQEAAKESLWDRLMHRWLGFKVRCRALLKTVRSIRHIISSILEVFRDEGVKIGLSKVKEEAMRLLRKCKPRKLDGYLKIGFEDPSITGRLLAVLAVLRGIWDYRVEVTPDFEHSICEAEITAKGYIRGIWLLRVGWKLMFDKDIRYAIDQCRGMKG